MLVKALVHVEPRHAHVDKRLARNVVRVTPPKARDVPHFGGEFNYINTVVVSALLAGCNWFFSHVVALW